MRGETQEAAVLAPRIVIVFFVSLLAIHAAVSFAGADVQAWAYETFSLIPERLLAASINAGLGEKGHALFNLISFNFLHADWTHVGVNAFWLLAFGTPVARRVGGFSFILLFLVSGMLGGLLQVVMSEPQFYSIAIVGASASVSGMMGAACRFAFSPRHRQARWPERPRLLSTRETLRQPITLAFISVWFALNAMVGVLAPMGVFSPDGAPMQVAWVAHVGGFVTGFYFIALCDKPPVSPSGGPGRFDYGSWR